MLMAYYDKKNAADSKFDEVSVCYFPEPAESPISFFFSFLLPSALWLPLDWEERREWQAHQHNQGAGQVHHPLNRLWQHEGSG